MKKIITGILLLSVAFLYSSSNTFNVKYTRDIANIGDTVYSKQSEINHGAGKMSFQNTVYTLHSMQNDSVAVIKYETKTIIENVKTIYVNSKSIWIEGVVYDIDTTSKQLTKRH